MCHQGKLIIISAPSGSGKSTIIGRIMQDESLRLSFSVSATTRPRRGEEVNGVDYYYKTVDEFKQMIADDLLVEYQEVYEGRYYGTLTRQVELQRQNGQNVVFDIDVKGGINVKHHYGEQALSIFIQPPSIDELRRRLTLRATDSKEQIATRIDKAAYELTFAPEFDHVVVNNDLEKAKAEVLQLVKSFLAE